MKFEVEYVLKNEKCFIEELSWHGDIIDFIDEICESLNKEGGFVVINPLYFSDVEKKERASRPHVLNKDEISFMRFFEVKE